MNDIRPVILCGGSGTRLWPLSRRDHPKQFLNLIGEQTLFEATLGRIQGLGCLPPIVVCGEPHRFTVRRQLDKMGFGEAQIIVEPAGRNTAPAIALAALLDDDPLLLVLPSDHYVDDASAFTGAVEVARETASSGRLVTFGVAPDHPSTGFGYLKLPDEVGDELGGMFEVDRFVEKPDLETAEKFLAGGRHLWNAGIFLFRASTFLSELKRYRPEIFEIAAIAMSDATRDMNFVRPGKAFLDVAGESIDYAVMEQSHLVSGTKLSCGWSDLGSFDAIGRAGEHDAQGNYSVGDVNVVDTEESVLISSGRLVSVVGLKNIVVAETTDAILVADRDSSQSVASIVASLEAAGRPEVKNHRKVYRPWGSYEVLSGGPGFQVKRINVYPGQTLSLQSHNHRSEHWVVVSGLATVTRGEETFQLSANESTYIPVGCVHRLANSGNEPVEIVEIQVGEYLGEDDIVRYEDRYGRVDVL